MANFKKAEIVDLLSEYNNDISLVAGFIASKAGISADNCIKAIKLKVCKLRSEYHVKRSYLKKSSLNFNERHSTWLNSLFLFPMPLNCGPSERGRPKLKFSEMSNRSQRREISNICVKHNNDSQKLLEAGTYAAKRSGDKNLSSALNNISNRPELKRELLKKSAHEALAFFFK